MTDTLSGIPPRWTSPAGIVVDGDVRARLVALAQNPARRPVNEGHSPAGTLYRSRLHRYLRRPELLGNERLNTIARARAAIEEWSHKDILDAGSKAQLNLDQSNCSEMPDRRFPPPWSVDDPNMKLGQECYIVRDANGYPLSGPLRANPADDQPPT